jgi:two-component system CheB/CheR fusion protein
VGIGASAGSFRSLEALFAQPKADNGAAYIVIFQQKDGIDPAVAVEALSRQSGLRASIADDGMRLEANRIYVAAADDAVAITKDRIKASRTEQPPGERGSIDSFLLSLADEWGAGAVGVVLAGLGSDGTLGATAIKENGGLVLAEGVPEDVSALAASSAAAAVADYVLPVSAILERISAYVANLVTTQDARQLETLGEEATPVLGRVATLLRNKTGHDFHGYKQNTFIRRVQRRMQVVQINEVDSYIEFLRNDPEEIHHLFQDLLIGVTQFFRDQKEFELLEREVIPKLLDGKGADDQVRIWVLGCATGEESYSIAILLREAMGRLDTVPQVQIFATDIDGRALASARAGRYSEAIKKDISPERLARWFVREGNTYCVAKELREICIFSSHNVIKDAPFSRIDLISCRNLLIYLNSDLQNRIIPLFHFALRNGGFLFLGPSENVTRHTKLFAPIDRRHRIFGRVESATRVLPEFPLTVMGDRARRAGEVAPIPRLKIEPTLSKRAERVAERYAPAYVVIDENYDILHFAGRTGRYLDPSTGAANLNLLNLVHRDLRLDLRAALHKAVSHRESVKLERLQVGEDGERLNLNIVIEPVVNDINGPLALMVLFQENAVAEISGEVRDQAASTDLRDEHVQRLESELRLTKERLQATIEELESTNEELKSSNEEYQSINEELQSANEELETSKEELQSVNEELQTVNGELAHRVSELAKANSDLKNLLESTQIATIFLDNDLRIKNFTPMASEIFHLIDADIGRPITHITSRVAYEELENDVRKVLRTLGSIEREIAGQSGGSRYLARVLPYRSIDNFIGGAVLTFLDVTPAARPEMALRQSEERFRRIAQALPGFLFISSDGLEWEYVNPRYYEYTGLSEGEALGEGWMAALHPDDVRDTGRRWAHASEAGESFEQEFRLRGKGGGYRWFLAQAAVTTDPAGRQRWYGTITDIHERRRAEGRQRLLFGELQHRVKNVLSVVRSIATRTLETSDTVEGFAAHFAGRIDALARTQTVLARDGEAVELEELVREELLAQSSQHAQQIVISGPSVRLREKAAETLGLAIHELATNAVKYGALADGSGKLSVTWQAYDTGIGPRLTFEWRESGVPLVNAKPARNGFGREMIEQGLPYDLGATTVMEFGQGGLRCVIEVVLTEQMGVIIQLPEATKDEADDPKA